MKTFRNRSDKDRICIEVFHRHEVSLGIENKQKYGLARFHWAILIRPKDIKRIGTSTSYDVSDASRPTNFVDLNPNRDWTFRSRKNVDPFRAGLFLGAVVIGKVPANKTTNDVHALLAHVPLPLQDQPDQNCVTWTRDAIRALQAAGFADVTDVEEILSAGEVLGDRTIAQGYPEDPKDMFLTPAGKQG